MKFTKEQIISACRERLAEKMGVSGRVHIETVNKDNVKLTSITFIEEDACINTRPTVYAEWFEDKDYASLDEILAEFARVFKKYPSSTVDAEELFGADNVRKNVYFKLAKYDNVKDILNEYPHRVVFGDLVLTYYIVAEINGTEGIIRVSNKVLNAIGWTESQLYFAAKINVANKTSVIPWDEVFENIGGFSMKLVMFDMHTDYGAAACVQYMAQTRGRKAMIPVSIHDVIVVDMEHDIVPDEAELDKLMQVMNYMCPDGQMLSDHIYNFNDGEYEAA